MIFAEKARGLLAVAVFGLLAVSCIIKDEDRCPEGYEFVEVTLSCHPVEEKETDDTGETPGTTGTTPDSEPGTDSEPAGVPTGLGESCADNPNACEDAGYEANYCVVPPPAPKTAYCSTRDCLDGRACSEGYRCCDCTNSDVLPKLSACLKDGDADLAGTPIGGCDCEG